MGSQVAGVQKKVSLLSDAKFRWLIFSVVVVAVFEFLSLVGWHLPPAIDAPLFAIIILVIGHRTLLNGLRALIKLNFRSINLLLLIATAGAFYLGEYEEAAVVIVLFTLGGRLEQFGIETSKSALQSLVDRTPKTATVRGEGWNNEVPISQIAVGDILVIKPSDMIAMDAEVVSGSSSVDESTITGEPLPKDKHAGSKVFAGTLNMQGYLEARVTKLRLLDLIEDGQTLGFELGGSDGTHVTMLSDQFLAVKRLAAAVRPAVGLPDGLQTSSSRHPL